MDETAGPVALFVVTVVSVGIWIAAEHFGKSWQRYLAGLGMAICFAACGAGVASVMFLNQIWGDRARLNFLVSQMVDETIARVRGDDHEALVVELREMNRKIGPKEYRYWTFEEPFVEFVQRKNASSPEVDDVP